MTAAQNNRHSKTTVEVVNEKREARDFNRAYRMLGRDRNEAPEEKVRRQKTEDRRKPSALSHQLSVLRFQPSAPGL
jgi:hypothetical protein